MKYKQDKAQQEEANERNKKAKLEAEAKRLDKENAAKRYFPSFRLAHHHNFKTFTGQFNI